MAGRKSSLLTTASIIVYSIVLCLSTLAATQSSIDYTADDFPLPIEERIDSYVLAFINYTYTTAEGHEEQFAEEKAKYGEGRILNVAGLLIHLTSGHDRTDHTACSLPIRGTNGGNLPGAGQPWIALIKRGQCTFEQKVKNAYDLNASGVIVYNEEETSTLDKMKIIEKARNITAVFTYKTIGEKMGEIVDSDIKLWVSISEGQHGLKRITSINKTSVLFVSVSFIILMIVSLIWLLFFYIQRFRYLQTKDKKSRELCSVAKRIISKIPTKQIGKGEEKDDGDDCCPICIEPYKYNECLRVLPCRHEFHKNCIDPWLLEHRTCPMCKMDVLKHYGFVHVGSIESILQVDMDIEIGDSVLLGDDDDLFEFVNPPNDNATPTFRIQGPSGDRFIRSSSPMESVDVIQREVIPIRSHSSLDCNNSCIDDSINSKSTHQLQRNMSRKALRSPIIRKASAPNFLGPDDAELYKDSNSLPNTLTNDKAPEECRGSNNCYVRVPKAENSCRKLKTSGILRQCNDDEDNDELLLATNEKVAGSGPSAGVMSSLKFNDEEQDHHEEAQDNKHSSA